MYTMLCVLDGVADVPRWRPKLGSPTGQKKNTGAR